MLWGVVVLLAAALSAESYPIRDSERLAHGRQLKIYLSRNAEKLEFIPAYDPNRVLVYWEKGRGRMIKGRVSGSGNDRRWYIDQVTYEDEGTYIERDFWNKEVSSFRVAVTPRHNYVKCIAGETLYISLEGIEMAHASLVFSGPASNITLVRDGSRVSQDLPEYFDRVYTRSKIEILNVNTSDEGHYFLKDRKDRLVSDTRMDLTDKHDTLEGNPLMALLLLLGIPAGICCCCRKKIFKKNKASTTATLQSSPGVVHTPPAGPVGPSPPYNSPGQPGAVYYHGPDPSMDPTVHPPPPATGPAPWNGPPPSPGFNPAYPPQNPAYPPAGPATMPPAGPQWNGPPPGQYPPGPGAPMGYAPVMYSSPPPAAGEPVKEEMNMNMAPSPADPLLNAAPEAAAPAAAPTGPPTSSSYQFNVEGASTPNFL